jgi:hypothetical protein
MLKVTEERIDQVESEYAGFRKLVEHWEAKDLPSCPSCGSANTAEVSAGLVGISMRLAGATSKIKLLPNGHPADFYCNQCARYFDGPDGADTEPKLKPGGITIAGKDALEAIKTPEGTRALYEQVCEALGIAPVPSESDRPDDEDEAPGWTSPSA